MLSWRDEEMSWATPDPPGTSLPAAMQTVTQRSVLAKGWIRTFDETTE